MSNRGALLGFGLLFLWLTTTDNPACAVLFCVMCWIWVTDDLPLPLRYWSTEELFPVYGVRNLLGLLPHFSRETTNTLTNHHQHSPLTYHTYHLFLHRPPITPLPSEPLDDGCQGRAPKDLNVVVSLRIDSCS
jgi:hypothetical protein